MQTKTKVKQMTRITGKKSKQIFETNNYDQFSPIDENRVIIESHLKGLKDAIKLRDLGKSVPIIVNNEGEIFDGHHRFKARKELGLPIYYVNHPDLELEDVTLLNVKRRNWTYPEYARFYAKLFTKTNNSQYRNYPQFEEFKDHFELSDTQAINYFTLQRGGGKVREDFKSGVLESPDYERSVHLATFIDACMRNTAPIGALKTDQVRTAGYISALWFVFDIELIDNAKFTTSVSKGMKRFHPKTSRTTEKWLTFFEEEIIRSDLKKGNMFPELKGLAPLWLTQLYLKERN